MAKKILLLVGTAVALIAGIVMFAAFELHHVNLNAHVENAITVSPDKIGWGTVFSNEQAPSACTLDTADDTEFGATTNNHPDDGNLNYTGPDGLANTNDDLTPGNCIKVVMSDSFKACDNNDPGQKIECPGGVLYKVSWAAKQTGQGEQICPYVTVSDSDATTGDGDTPVGNSWCDDPTTLPEVIWNGALSMSPIDHYDLWDLDLWAPVCDTKKAGAAPPGFPTGMSHTVSGCVDHEIDLNGAIEIETTGWKAKPPDG